MTQQKNHDIWSQLEQSVLSALETYSNVHRGSGYHSQVTTHLFEQARVVVLEYLGLSKSTYEVIFCSPRRSELITRELGRDHYRLLSSKEIGLALGVRAIAIKRGSIPRKIVYDTGGGTTRLISKEWVIWAGTPDRFEAGTPAIINVIAFAKALRLIKHYGSDIFKESRQALMNVQDLLYRDELGRDTGKALLEELKKRLIGNQSNVPTTSYEQLFVNLDNSASTPTFGPIWNSFRQGLKQPQQIQDEIVEEVRRICANALGAPAEEYDIFFTSNTTEAINLVAESLGRESESEVEPVILNTLLEHSSNDLPWRMIPGATLIRINVDRDGLIDHVEMERLVSEYNQEGQYGTKRVKLVAISGASNVLGICNNLKEISQIVHKYGAHLLVDGAQLVAHRKIDMEATGIDYLAFSGHKVYAPFGCGALIVRKELLRFSKETAAQIQSSGEENFAGIAALGKALQLLQQVGMDVVEAEEQRLTAYLLQSLSRIPGLKIHGIGAKDNPHFSQKLGVVAIELKGKMANEIAKKLALFGGIGVRYGCHCSHIIVKHILGVSPGLERFQKVMLTILPKVQLPGVLRVSLGIQNTRDDVNRLVQTLEKIASKGNHSSSHSGIDSGLIPASKVRQSLKRRLLEAEKKVYS